MMTRSRKGDSTRSTTEEETSGGDTMATGTTAGATSETVTDSTAATEHSTAVEDADITVVEKGKKKQPKTVSNNSSKRKKELEARLELEMLQLEEIRMKAKLANTKLELARADDTDLSDQEGEEEAEVEAAAVQATAAWVSTTKSVERNEGEPPCELPAPEVAIAAPSHTNQLAEAILQAVKSASENKASSFMQRAPKYVSELHQFEGDACDWMAFKATYEDTRTLFSDIENMGRLRRAVKGKAKEAVKSLLFTQIDPQEVMTALERRFGRPTYLIRSEIENIEKLPPMSEDARELVRYAGAVSNTVSVVKQMKRKSYLHSSDISSRIIEKMCTLVRFKWYEYRAKKEDEDEPILLSLMQFFNDMVDQFEMHEFVGSRMKKESMRFRTRTAGSRGVHTTRAARNQENHTSEDDSDGEHECRTKSASVFSCKEGNRKERDKITCPQCDGEHTLLKCKKFSEASIKDKWEQAKQSGFCYKCLEGRHRGFSCKAKPCGKCKKGHHLLLHYEEATKPTTQEMTTQTIASTVNTTRAGAKAYLKIVPVELMGPKGNVCVYALMDEGSTVTLIEDSVVEKIGVQGPEEELRIEGVGGHRMDQKAKKIDIKMRGLFGRNTEKLSGYSVKKMHLTPQEVNEKDLEGCEHLEEIQDQLKYPNAKPSVLIGQDNWNLITSQEVKHGHRSKPVASRTQLGWVLHGLRSISSAPVKVVNHLVIQPSFKDDNREWRWAPTKHIVVDDATRGAPKDYSKEHRWFAGPSFLDKGQEEWPRDEKDFTKDTGEEKPRAVTLSLRRVAHTAVPGPGRFAMAILPQVVDAFNRSIAHRTRKRTTKKERDPALKKSRKKDKTPVIMKRSSAELNLRQKALYVENRRNWHGLEVHSPRSPTHGWLMGTASAHRQDCTGSDTPRKKTEGGGPAHPATGGRTRGQLTATILREHRPQRRRSTNHFLISRSSEAHMFSSFDDAELVGSPSWRTSQRLADHFWARWVREYLPTLSPRYFQGPHYRDPTVGDLVLLVDHTLPRCSWPRGVISATYPGPDGRTRIVDVRTQTGVLRRPASRLVVIVPASSPLQAEVRGTEGETVGDAACEASTSCDL